jgi:hypothetical protein
LFLEFLRMVSPDLFGSYSTNNRVTRVKSYGTDYFFALNKVFKY